MSGPEARARRYNWPVPHPQVMFMLRLLAAVGWADGELAESEAAALERMINASDLDDDERATARTWLSAAVELDTAAVEGLNDNQRLMTYQAALRMAMSDDEFAESERAFLGRVREALGLSEAQASELEAEMPKYE